MKIGLLMYRYEHASLPACFVGLFQSGSECHSYPTRGSHSYRPIYMYAHSNTVAYRYSIRSTGPKVWNKFLLCQASIIGLYSFKDRLRTFTMNEN